MTAPASIQPETEFDRLWDGVFYSLMSWKQLSDFWGRIDHNSDWYLYAIGETLPASPSTPDQVNKFILEIDALLHRDHHETYCGIVYADDLEKPTVVKIYDPNHLGSSCGSSKNPPLPGWIMSQFPPTEKQPKHVIPGNRKRWWQALFSSAE